MTDGRLPSESIQKGDIGACDQACDQDNTLSAPTPPAVSRSQANNSNTSTNSTSHTGCLGTPSTAAQPPVQNGTSSSNSSPSSSTVALCDLQELAIIGSGSSGVVKKVLHKPSQQVVVLELFELYIKQIT